MKAPKSNDDILASEAAKLSRLPPLVRYYDDYADEWRVIRDPSESSWKIEANGMVRYFDHAGFDRGLTHLFKHFAIWSLSKMHPVTATFYQSYITKVPASQGSGLFVRLLTLPPMELRAFWERELHPKLPDTLLVTLKSFLHFACEMSLGMLQPGYADLVSSFRLPKKDKYAAVKLGEVFLTAKEEAALIAYIDTLSEQLRSGSAQINNERLRGCCILITSYQYGFRPIQIAKVKLADVRAYEPDDEAAVHITFGLAKQRGNAKLRTTTRPIKREWAYLFIEFVKRRRANPAAFVSARSVSDSLFGLSPSEVSISIRATTGTINGDERSATDLRHTAAQRLVDAGATKEELAEFMGHAYTDTGLVYFDASPSQAAKINKALALSPIYSTIVEAARTRSIDKSALLRLPPDKQIGGVPHGIPIAGIGGCDLGQSLCVKNPVLSCYTCHKFLPIVDAEVHQSVLNSLRPVVRQFYDSSRDESGQSPAFTQLTQTLNAVQSVIQEVGGNFDE